MDWSPFANLKEKLSSFYALSNVNYISEGLKEHLNVLEIGSGPLIKNRKSVEAELNMVML